jgi:hypothetical protein
LLNSEVGIPLNWAVFEVLDRCGEGSSGFLFTEHLVLWCDEISSIEETETLTYRGKNLIGKYFFLRVSEIRVMEETSAYIGKKLNRENFSPSSYRKFELQKFELRKKHNMEKTGVFFPVT